MRPRKKVAENLDFIDLLGQSLTVTHDNSFYGIREFQQWSFAL